MLDFDFDSEKESIQLVSPTLLDLEDEIAANIKLAFVFGDEKSEAIIVTSFDNFYAIGSNKDGYLGFGHKNPVSKWTKNEILSHKNIIKIVKNLVESSFFLCLTEDGNIYGWGDNRHGQLGYGSAGLILRPKLIVDNVDLSFKDIKCGAFTCMGLTYDGEIYLWGANQFGQLGDGTRNSVLLPQKVNIKEAKVSKIYCSGHSSFAIMENGDIYCWGSNEAGLLCLNTFYDSIIPTLITNLKGIKISKFACGIYHALLIDIDGNLFAWGYNKYGQVGDNTTENRSTPQRIYLPEKVNDVVAYDMVSACLCKNGLVYVWGHYGGENYKIPKLFSVKLFEVINPKIVGVLFKFRKDQIGSKVPRKIKELLNDPKVSDFKFIIDDQVIHAHKTILSNVSNYFSSLFNGKWSENSENEMVIIHYSYEAYYSFIHYIYSGDVITDYEHSIELLDIANSYLENDLKSKTSKLIADHLDCSYFPTIYSAAIKFNSIQLEEDCIEFAKNHKKELLSDFSNFESIELPLISQLLRKLALNGAFD